MINNLDSIGNIHDEYNRFFGYKIVGSDSEDPYTISDINQMTNNLSECYKENFHAYYARYPLQCMINIVNFYGGECFWHECTDSNDIAAYFSREMLESMRDSGFEYVARIACTKDNEKGTKELLEFVEKEHAELGEAISFNDLLYYYSDYVDCSNSSGEDLPCINPSIFFSTIPIVSSSHEQLLNPISAEIIKIKNMEKTSKAVLERKKLLIEKDIEDTKNMLRKSGVPEDMVESTIENTKKTGRWKLNK